MDEMMEGRVRSHIVTALGRTTYPEEAWGVLVAKGHIDDYQNGRITDQELLGYAKALAFYGDLVAHTETTSKTNEIEPKINPPGLDGYEEQRAATLATYLELRIAAHPRVLQWRKDAWGSANPAASGYQITESGRVRDDLSGFSDLGSNAQPSGYLEYFTRQPGTRVQALPFYRGSSLERLRDLSEDLRNEVFPLWSQAETAWIIVAGTVKDVPKCLRGEIDGFANNYLTYRTISLTIEPWIASETVTRAYQYMQQFVLGRRPRAFSERNLTMTRFVMQQLREMLSDESSDEQITEMSWRRVMKSWNQQHQQWSYDDERQFYNDVHRIVRAVARPYDTVGTDSEVISTLPTLSIPEIGRAHV